MSDVSTPHPILLLEENQNAMDFTRYAFSKSSFINPIEVRRHGVEVFDLMGEWQYIDRRPVSFSCRSMLRRSTVWKCSKFLNIRIRPFLCSC